MKKRWMGLLLVLALVLALPTGCGRKNEVVSYEDPNREVTSITFFGNKYEPENVAVIEEILSGFMAEYEDIRVSYESMKGSDYYEALRKRMASHHGNDVFMVDHDTLLELEAAGQLADLSGLSVIPRYTEQMRGQMEGDGGIHWVPTTVSVFGLYCNLDLLEEWGQAVPGTLPEWEAACAAFARQGVTPIVANNDISLKTLAIGRGFYQVYRENRQAEVFGRLNSGKVPLSGYLEDGFALVKGLIDRGYVDAERALVTQKTSDDLEEFAKGEAPFLLTGAWAAGRVESMAPGFAFEVVPLPVLEDGALLVINPDTRLSVNADSEHLDAALKFVEYFTREENIHRFADQQSSFCPLEGDIPSSVPAVGALLPCYTEGRTVIGSDGLLELPIWSITAEVSRMLLEGEPLEAAMDWMDRQGGREP